MKAFLMYKEKDFDPKQILIQRETKLRPWVKDESLNLNQMLPWNEESISKDLGLDILFNAMARGDNFLFEVSKVALLNSTNDIDSILYRQQILRDCLNNIELVKELYEITVEAMKKSEDKFWSLFNKHSSSVLFDSVRTLRTFVFFLKKIKVFADANKKYFKSDGFIRMFNMLNDELNDEYMMLVENHLNQLEFKDGILITAQLGKGNKISNIILHKIKKENRSWLNWILRKKHSNLTYHIHPRDETGARALSELRDKSLDSVANALAQSVDHIYNFFKAIRTELAFYIGCINLNKILSEKQKVFCFPTVVPFGNKKLSFSGLYDICLALSSEQKIISNDLEAEGKDIIIITGANSGGKSTYLRSLGIAQLMAQCGMFVPAENYTAELKDGIVSHFKREEDSNMISGKLDEELSRMNQIIDKINSKFLILFNESFAATNEKEGAEIARQITKALIDKGIKVIFVTHNYEYANIFYNMKLPNILFLRAERKNDGTRTFKIIEAEPLQTSFGKDLYNKIFEVT